MTPLPFGVLTLLKNVFSRPFRETTLTAFATTAKAGVALVCSPSPRTIVS